MTESNAAVTYFTEKELNKHTKEERETFLDYLFGIPFLKNLTSPTRPYTKDLERWDSPYSPERKQDPKGKIAVDFANPHILEDMDYFRQSAIHFQTHGKYTLARPSPNIYSDYVKFWDQEIRRCWYGMSRESDGEWITGYHYFYLNYSPILRSVSKGKGRKVGRAVDFPDFHDGDYWFFHYLEYARENGKHGIVLKKRGAGYSYKAGGKLARNFILGEDETACREVSSFAVANEKEYLVKDGVLNKFISIVDFCGDHTPWPRRRELKDQWSTMHWMMGYKDPESNLEKGTKNQVLGVTLKNDPERARGKRGVLIEWEEFGKFQDSIRAWNISRPSVEEDGYTFGLMVGYGTGGTKGASFEGLRKLFYNPNGYNVQGLKNVYDKNSKEGAICAFFHGAYLNSKGHMDKNGNSDVTSALMAIVKDRIKVKYNSNDPATLVQVIAEKPITPQESIMKVGGNIFPVSDIRDYLEEARINESQFTATSLVGDLVLLNDTEVKFSENPNKIPIRKYSPDVDNVEGAVEIFKIPEMDRSGQVQPLRYIAGIDPVDNDYLESGSLASILVLDLWTDQLVAEYTGRPLLAEDFYEICRRLLLYYNAQGNYENNIKGLFGYFNNKNSLYLLCDTPQYLRDIEEVKSVLLGNRSKGTRTTEGTRAEGKRLQKSWMLQPYTPPEGEPTIILRTIKSLGYLEELYEWNNLGNFDRVSAMDMLMLLRSDRLRLVDRSSGTEEPETDEFILQNFDTKHGILYEDSIKTPQLFKNKTPW